MRQAKWYRPEKHVLRPFSHRLWCALVRMRGGPCLRLVLLRMKREGRRENDMRPMFEPARGRGLSKVWRWGRRDAPYWSRKA